MRDMPAAAAGGLEDATGVCFWRYAGITWKPFHFMGIYTEYIDAGLGNNFPALQAERKKQLKRISELRGRPILVYAADLDKNDAPLAISYPDLMPVTDQLASIPGPALDLILETPGGSAATAEQIVKIIRGRFTELGVIVPGAAMSAGTIMAMAADEILMDDTSGLGPIDAQLFWQGKVFSAEAPLKGFERIKQEVEAKGLNRAYIPILQGISPGELESAENAMALARELVRDWLARYKFKDWNIHSSNGQPVTPDEKTERANQIAEALGHHSRWRMHGRSIMLSDLEGLRLKITNFSKQPDLADAIHRYFVLMRMTFDGPIYKLFETPTTQIYRAQVTQVVGTAPAGGPGAPAPPVSLPAAAASAKSGALGMTCKKCGQEMRLQVNFEPGVPLQPGMTAFPDSGLMPCPKCGTELDLNPVRADLEKRTGRKIV